MPEPSSFCLFCAAAAPGQRDRHRGTGLSPSGAGVSDYGFPLRLVGGDQEGISMRELEASKASVLFVSPSNRMKARDAIPMSRRFEIPELGSTERPAGDRRRLQRGASIQR